MKHIDLLQEINNLSKTHALQRNEIDEIMIEFAGRITKSLGIDRMSVWLISSEKGELTSMGEYDRRNDSFQKNSVIPVSLCPEYFEALEKDEVLYIENVLESTVTKGLKESYCIPNDVITLLDIPLRFEGKMIGVMCFEKTGDTIKAFDDKERFFAQALSMVFSSNLEARKRRALQHHLDQELRDKETLLQEVHHRVKNNLSVISSLLNMQAGNAKDAYHRELLEECRGKIQSIADIHEIVYKNRSFSAISVRTYFTQLLNGIHEFYANKERNVSHHVHVEDFDLSIEHLIPLGLITNEVVTNCYKHAFKKMKDGTITLNLELHTNKILLSINDNGVGFSSTTKPEGNLGMEIIHDLAEQIDATYSYEGKDGTQFQLETSV